MLRLIAFILSLAILSGTTQVVAECAVAAGVCSAFAKADLVFLADVVSMAPAAGPTRSGVITDVRFKVIERFKGPSGEDHIQLSLSPSSEEFEYTVGQRVLVYAHRSQSRWRTACTRTRAVSSSDPELPIVRALRDKRRGGVVEGYVGSAGVPIVITRQGAVIAQVKSAFPDGHFETGWLDPGAYEISVGDRGTRQPVIVRPDAGCMRADARAGRESRHPEGP